MRFFLGCFLPNTVINKIPPKKNSIKPSKYLSNINKNIPNNMNIKPIPIGKVILMELKTSSSFGLFNNLGKIRNEPINNQQLSTSKYKCCEEAYSFLNIRISVNNSINIPEPVIQNPIISFLLSLKVPSSNSLPIMRHKTPNKNINGN